LTTILLAALAISALASLILCWLYISSARELHNLQFQTSVINQRQAVMNALATDVMEYSKKNPAVDPILESVFLKQKSSPPAATNKPPTK
jgi:hypothetical protein